MYLYHLVYSSAIFSFVYESSEKNKNKNGSLKQNKFNILKDIFFLLYYNIKT